LPSIGPVVGVSPDWRPTARHGRFDKEIHADQPWQFANMRVNRQVFLRI